jgi:hypothetical protein
MSKLDEILEEIEAYEKLHDKRVSYGDYMWKILPKMTPAEHKEVKAYADKLRKEKERKKRLQDVRISGLNKGKKAKHESDIPYWDW